MSENQEVLTLTQSDEIPCMLLPLDGQTILVPTVTVAEMAPMKPLDEVPGAPSWVLGMYNWRNMKVPVLSFELLNGSQAFSLNNQGRVAVLNNTGVDDELPFVAVHTQGIPRMARVGEKDISENKEVARKPFDLIAVRVGLEEFIIPDVSAMEAAYVKADIKI